jgi:hypothetical protein
MGYLLYSTVFFLLVLSTGIPPPLSHLHIIANDIYSPVPNPSPLDTPHAFHLRTVRPPLLNPIAFLPLLLPRLLLPLLPPPHLLQRRHRIRLLLFRLRPLRQRRSRRFPLRSRRRLQTRDPEDHEEQESQL